MGLGGSLVRAVRTAPVYRMYSLGPKPALIRQPAGAGGSAFELEVWALPIEAVGCVPPLVLPAIEHARTSRASSAASSGALPD